MSRVSNRGMPRRCSSIWIPRYEFRVQGLGFRVKCGVQVDELCHEQICQAAAHRFGSQDIC